MNGQTREQTVTMRTSMAEFSIRKVNGWLFRMLIVVRTDERFLVCEEIKRGWHSWLPARARRDVSILFNIDTCVSTCHDMITSEISHRTARMLIQLRLSDRSTNRFTQDDEVMIQISPSSCFLSQDKRHSLYTSNISFFGKSDICHGGSSGVLLFIFLFDERTRSFVLPVSTNRREKRERCRGSKKRNSLMSRVRHPYATAHTHVYIYLPLFRFQHLLIPIVFSIHSRVRRYTLPTGRFAKFSSFLCSLSCGCLHLIKMNSHSFYWLNCKVDPFHSVQFSSAQELIGAQALNDLRRHKKQVARLLLWCESVWYRMKTTLLFFHTHQIPDESETHFFLLFRRENFQQSSRVSALLSPVRLNRFDANWNCSHRTDCHRLSNLLTNSIFVFLPCVLPNGREVTFFSSPLSSLSLSALIPFMHWIAIHIFVYSKRERK